MFTTNDSLFCLLHSCYDGLESGKLLYYMYVYQTAGLNYNFKYKLNASGLTCRQLNEYFDFVINSDKVEIVDGVIKLTRTGKLYYDNVALTQSEWDFINYIKAVLDNMSEQELYLICLTDMIVYDTLRKYGVDGLITQKERIKNSISCLSREYSDDNFNEALKFIREIKNWR